MSLNRTHFSVTGDYNQAVYTHFYPWTWFELPKRLVQPEPIVRHQLDKPAGENEGNPKCLPFWRFQTTGEISRTSNTLVGHV